MAVDPRGGRKHTVNQEPYGGSNYPLRDRSPVPGYSDLTELLSDLWLGHETGSEPARPLRISWMYGFGISGPASPIVPVHAQDLEIVDADDEIFLDTRTASSFSSSAWGGWLRILEWRFPDKTLRLVHLEDWPADVDPPEYPIYFEPQDATLDNRTIQRVPAHVRSIRVDQDVLTGTSVVFRGRYNTEILADQTTATDGGVRSTRISFDNSPGIGAGRFGPTCEERLIGAPLHFLAGAGPDPRGNLRLLPDQCVRIEPVVVATDNLPNGLRSVRLRAGAVRIQDDCNPCHSCDDFIAIYEATRKLRDRLAALVERARDVQVAYEDGLARFERQRECREGFSLRITQEAYCPCRLGIAVGFCNPQDVCVDGLVIPISFTYSDLEGCGTVAASTPASARILPNSTYRGGFVRDNRSVAREAYMLNGRWPHYWAYFPKVQPHQQATVTFVMEFPNCSSSDRIETTIDAYSVPGVLGGESGSPPIPDYTPGVGPGPAAIELRVVNCSIKAFSALRPICEEL